MHKLQINQQTCPIEENPQQSTQTQEISPEIRFGIRKQQSGTPIVNSSSNFEQRQYEIVDSNSNQRTGSLKNPTKSSRNFVRGLLSAVSPEMAKTVTLLTNQIDFASFQNSILEVEPVDEEDIQEYLQEQRIFKLDQEIDFCFSVMDDSPLIKNFFEGLFQRAPQLILHDVILASFIFIRIYHIHLSEEGKLRNRPQAQEAALSYLASMDHRSFHVLKIGSKSEDIGNAQAQRKEGILSLLRKMVGAVFTLMDNVPRYRSQDPDLERSSSSEEEDSECNPQQPVKKGKSIKKQRKNKT